MQRTRSIKWGLVVVMLIMALSVCAACTRNRIAPDGNLNNGTTSQGAGVSNTGTRVIEGYIVDFDNNRVTIDQVEFLTTSHTDRINQLGLDTTRDFANGYYIHNDNDGTSDRVTYPLASNVQVRFAELTTNGVRDGVGTTTNGMLNGTTYTTDGMNNGMGATTNSILDGVNDGSRNNATTPGYTPNNTMGTGNVGTGVGNAIGDVGTGIGNAIGSVGTGVGNAVTHLGQTLGGVAGGVVGGVEMMTNRFGNGVAASDHTPYFITIQNGYVTSIEEVHAYSNFAGTGAYNTTTGINTTTGVTTP